MRDQPARNLALALDQQTRESFDWLRCLVEGASPIKLHFSMSIRAEDLRASREQRVQTRHCAPYLDLRHDAGAVAALSEAEDARERASKSPV